jgi:hypothetical protein
VSIIPIKRFTLEKVRTNRIKACRVELNILYLENMHVGINQINIYL